MGRKARQDWYSLYRGISPKIEADTSGGSLYGFIRKEAEIAGYEEKVLKRMLNAGAFLERVAGDQLRSENIRCGYAHIELLERLHRLDSIQAKEWLPRVLSQDITLKELSEAIAVHAKNPGQAQFTARSKARSRIAEHRRMSIELARKVGPAFFGNAHAEPILVRRFKSLGHFLLLNDPKAPIAVIPRLGDTSMKESKAAEHILTLALSYKNYFARIWLLFPKDSLLTQEVLAQAFEIGALDTWLFLAIPAEDLNGLIHYQNHGRWLVKGMDGIDDDAWEGQSLVDGRPMRGRLEILSK
ncbi:hypothetical protein [Pseudomonas sp.]|uniref:hypothetical protein n=1 Tax=Pseudomonas sp. TaxID=306 RepID=UPI00272B3CA2|nr:hypothetical protein [Pseudomonas sp.]